MAFHSFETKVLRAIRAAKLLDTGDRVLVAVSGGADSVALLHALDALSRRLQVSPVVAHLNHGLRGEEAARDADWVRAIAAALSRPARVEVRPVERARGESLEMAARRVRYEYLATCARETGCSVIATGHTADDQAETVLLRLLRGSGARGLSGIPVSRPAGESGLGGEDAAPRARVVRPLLERTREEVCAYLAALGVEYRIDPTNTSMEHLRNRVRAHIMPRIASLLNPAAASALARFASRERDIDRYLGHAGRSLLDEIGVCDDLGRVSISAGALAAVDPALEPYVVWAAAERAGADAAALEHAHIDACLALAAGRPGRRALALPGGLAVYRAGDRVEFVRGGPPARAGFAVRLGVPGCVATPSGARVSSALRSARPSNAASSDAPSGSDASFAVEFDWSVIRGPIEVRSRRSGDRIAPRGMSGRKSIQDLLVDRKVAWTARDQVPIVADGERILWVVGHAVSREAPVTAATDRALVLSLESSASPWVNR